MIQNVAKTTSVGLGEPKSMKFKSGIPGGQKMAKTGQHRVWMVLKIVKPSAILIRHLRALTNLVSTFETYLCQILE